MIAEPKTPSDESFMRRNAIFVAALAFSGVLIALSLIGPFLPGVAR